MPRATTGLIALLINVQDGRGDVIHSFESKFLCHDISILVRHTFLGTEVVSVFRRRRADSDQHPRLGIFPWAKMLVISTEQV